MGGSRGWLLRKGLTPQNWHSENKPFPSPYPPNSLPPRPQQGQLYNFLNFLCGVCGMFVYVMSIPRPHPYAKAGARILGESSRE